jgi:hypothetical protein
MTTRYPPDMLGNLVAETATRRPAEPGDLHPGTAPGFMAMTPASAE